MAFYYGRRTEDGKLKKDILRLIDESSSEFSKGQRQIAAYVVEHYDKAAYMTAAKLGKEVGVSESTVVRFVMELGFEGYPEFRKALLELVRSKLTAVQRIEVTNSLIETLTSYKRCLIRISKRYATRLTE